MATGEITNFRGERADGVLDPVDRKIRVLTRMVGDRLRKARELSGLSRRALSEMSGVSQRYLAQVEAGGGNISIALLLKVGDALGHRIEWFVGEDDPWTSEVLRVADLFRRADSRQRQAAIAALDPRPAEARKAQRIALVGLRGAGKTTLGRRAAAALGLPFAELNDEIEAEGGMTVDDVMALYGQEGYRTLEHRALSRFATTHEAVVLAVAGGIVSAPETYGLLLENFCTVWLRARPEDHMNRVIAQGDQRPMAGKPAAMDELKAILASREALYARADVTVDTSARTEREALDALLAAIGAQGLQRN